MHALLFYLYLYNTTTLIGGCPELFFLLKYNCDFRNMVSIGFNAAQSLSGIKSNQRSVRMQLNFLPRPVHPNLILSLLRQITDTFFCWCNYISVVLFAFWIHLAFPFLLLSKGSNYCLYTFRIASLILNHRSKMSRFVARLCGIYISAAGIARDF